MLKGLAITPPVIGRISIGKVVERNGKRLPEKDDQFTITSQLQNRNGWLPHPLDETLRAAAKGKLRSMPVRMLFNDPALNFRAEYTLFDRKTGRPTCMGNGEVCKRSGAEGVTALPCPAPDHCEFSKGECKPYGRLNVLIGDDQADGLGTFMFRTTSYNSIRSLTARLQYFRAISGDRLSGLPLELRLRGKTTTQSFGTPIFYVDLTIREGMTLATALAFAAQVMEERQKSGFDQAALDAVARLGLNCGVFEDSGDEAMAVAEEFYPDRGTGAGMDTGTDERKPASAAGMTAKPSLMEKLGRRMEKEPVGSAPT